MLPLVAGAALAQDRPVSGKPPPLTPGRDSPIAVRADPGAFVRVYGNTLAARVFSDLLAAERGAALAASLARVPGFACPARPEIVLATVFPWRGMGSRRAWIERFAVACQPATLRNFLVVEEGEGLRRIEMAPGASNTDPRLQRDLMPGIATAAARTKPAGCGEAPIVTGVVLTAQPDSSGAWRESWQVSQCGTASAVEVRFSPSPRGGTTWTVTGAR